MNIESIYLAFRKRFRLLFSGRYFVVRKRGISYLLDAYGYIDRNIEAYGLEKQCIVGSFGPSLETLDSTKSSEFLRNTYRSAIRELQS